jgi:pimeloyl-ACP methyl ester carboxylesterase
MRRHWKRIAGIAIAVLLLVGVLGYLWLTNLADPMPEAEAALVSDDAVTVDTDPWLTFTPAEASSTGLILYPGGRVPAEAYAPSVRVIAEAGYTSIIPSMPFGLAVLDANAADGIIEAHPEIARWVIAGHSLGGAMAAQYADGHDLDGLALWAAYPPDGTDLSAAELAATSVYATEDGLTTLDEVEASRAQLPPDTTFVKIAGGNHAGFGWYGEQDGDGTATISRAEQQAQVTAATLELLEEVEAGPSS